MKGKSLGATLLLVLAAACSSDQASGLLPPASESPSLPPAPTLSQAKPLESSPEASATHGTPSTIPPSDAALPAGLEVVYIVEDSLYLWSSDQTQRVLTQPAIRRPMLSPDGEWIIFRQDPDSIPRAESVWVIRADGSDLQRLLGPNDLEVLGNGSAVLFIDDIEWMPGRHELVFNTGEIIEGPPGERPRFDLNVLDLAGNVTQLTAAGQGGRFAFSPSGRYLVAATNSRIGLVDLESGEQTTLQEISDGRIPVGHVYAPSVAWDPGERFVIALVIPGQAISPDEGTGQEQVWRLPVEGAAERIFQREAYLPHAPGLSPNARYLLYLDTGCSDAQGLLHLHDLVAGEGRPLYCVWNVPWWAADSDHFIFWLDGFWQTGQVSASSRRLMDFLNLPADNLFQVTPQIDWIDNAYFLLTLRSRSRNVCTLSIATLEGVAAEIARTAPESCPEADFSLSE